ncbi:hypothetical protein [Ideonella sp.]|uniref:hypothetical protein n=1 Tax=Ideonella sp. TaxID=1929293 RepID=UPI0035B06846
MSWVDLGIVSVVVCNLLLLGLCTFMAWRMVGYVRDSQADLGALSGSLKAHAGRLNRSADDALSTFADLKRELARLADAARQGAAGGGRAGGRPSDPYQQWAARDPKALNRLVGRQGEMLSEVARVDAAQFEQWRRGKQAELEQLLQQHGHVQAQFEQLQQAHDAAVQRLREQELRARQAEQSAGEAARLQGELEAVRARLHAAEARAFAAEQLAAAAEDAGAAEHQDGSGGEPAAGDTAAAPRVKELAGRLAEAEADRQRLRRQLQQLQDQHKRTLTEKDFIEDRFLAMEAERPAEAAAA